MRVSDLVPGQVYDFRLTDTITATEQFKPGEIKRRVYLAPFCVDEIHFIQVADECGNTGLIPVELIVEVLDPSAGIVEVSDVE